VDGLRSILLSEKNLYTPYKNAQGTGVA